MGPYVSFRDILVPSWSLLVLLGLYKSLCVFMGLYGSLFVLIRAYRFLCVFVGLYVSSWILEGPDGSSLVLISY